MPKLTAAAVAVLLACAPTAAAAQHQRKHFHTHHRQVHNWNPDCCALNDGPGQLSSNLR